MQVEIAHVSKTFAGEGSGTSIHALNDVSLSVNAGEFICLLGPSGCGKSTILRLLAGLDTPDSGTVQIDGTLVTRPRNWVGMVFQDFALFPWLTVQENIGFGLKLRGEQEALLRDTVSRWIDLVGLRGFESMLPKQLSGGMKQRVAIARALALSPEVLLMDEPFGSLDSFTRMEMQEELIRLREQQSFSCVFVTHDIEEAVFLADRVVVMTPRPGAIKTVVSVPLPHRRDRAGEEFTQIRNYLLSLYERASSLPREVSR
jgi:NitT/TauT family transport system ATP-binding protein